MRARRRVSKSWREREEREREKEKRGGEYCKIRQRKKSCMDSVTHRTRKHFTIWLALPGERCVLLCGCVFLSVPSTVGSEAPSLLIGLSLLADLEFTAANSMKCNYRFLESVKGRSVTLYVWMKMLTSIISYGDTRRWWWRYWSILWRFPLVPCWPFRS